MKEQTLKERLEKRLENDLLQKPAWQLIGGILFAAMFPLLRAMQDARLGREGGEGSDKSRALKAELNSLEDTRQPDDLSSRAYEGTEALELLVKKETMENHVGNWGAITGGVLGILTTSPAGAAALMPHINSAYGKLSDTFRQDFSRLGDGSPWDKITGQALRDDFLNVLLCILAVGLCVVAGKLITLGTYALYNNSTNKDKSLHTGVIDVVGKAAFGSAVEFFPVIAKKMKNAWNQEEPPPAHDEENPRRPPYRKFTVRFDD